MSKPKPHDLPPHLQEQILAAVKEGESVASLVERLGIVKERIYPLLKQKGVRPVEIRKKLTAAKNAPLRELGEIEPELARQIAARYQQGTPTLSEVGVEFQVSSMTVRKALRQAGVKLRRERRTVAEILAYARSLNAQD